MSTADVTDAQKLEWLRKHGHKRGQLPTKAQTADQWRSLIFEQMRADRSSSTRILDVGCWAMITSIDVDVIEEIIRRIATYGVIEEPDEGGSGPGDDPRRDEVSSHRPTPGLSISAPDRVNQGNGLAAASAKG